MAKRIQFKLTELLIQESYTDGIGRIKWREAAEKIGISHVALWKMANNEPYNPSLAMLERLCEFFKCEPGDLLKYQKPKKKK